MITRGNERLHVEEMKLYINCVVFFRLCAGTLGTAATTGLLYQRRVIGGGDCGKIGEMKIGRGSEALGENLPQHHFVHHKSHMTRPGFEPGPPRWEASD
jgi:hypothetical protein